MYVRIHWLRAREDGDIAMSTKWYPNDMYTCERRSDHPSHMALRRRGRVVLREKGYHLMWNNEIGTIPVKLFIDESTDMPDEFFDEYTRLLNKKTTGSGLTYKGMEI